MFQVGNGMAKSNEFQPFATGTAIELVERMNVRTPVLMGIFLCVASQQALAEGTETLGTSQALRAQTQLHLDVLEPGVEAVVWSGLGTLTITSPTGSVLATLESEERVELAGHDPGTYGLALSQDQIAGGSWGVEVQSGGVTAPGRLYSTNWYFNAGSFAESAATNSSFYAKVPGGAPGSSAVIELKLDGLAGYVYEINANRVGLDGALGGKSAPGTGNSVTPEFPIYLAPPATSDYQHSVADVANLRYVGGTTVDVQGQPMDACNQILPGQSTGQFIFESTVNGTYHLKCDLNQDGIFSNSEDDLLLVGQSAPGTNVAEWDGTSLGVSIQSGVYECRVQVNTGEFHYVAWDIETSYQGMRLFQVLQSGDREGLAMYFDDSLVIANAVAMPNGVVGSAQGGSDGLFSGVYSQPATANENARAWGHFAGDGRGNNAYVDTYVWLDSSTSADVVVEAASSADSDADGLSDFEESCVVGSDPTNPDTDGDGRPDGEQYGSSSSTANGGLESNGRMKEALAARQIQRRYTKELALISEELSPLLPELGMRNSIAVAASPEDLIDYTNASMVHGANYIDDDNRMLGGILILESYGETYEHSKAICDRSKGSMLLDVQPKTVTGFNVIGSHFVNRESGTVDRAITLKLYETGAADAYVVHRHWLRDNYPQPEAEQRILNVQVWARHPGDEARLTTMLIEHLEGQGQISWDDKTLAVPPAFVRTGNTFGGTLELLPQSRESGQDLQAIVWSTPDTSGVVQRTAIPLQSGVLASLDLPLFGEATVQLVANDVIVDQLWLSDGTWAVLGGTANSCQVMRSSGHTGGGHEVTELSGCASASGSTDTTLIRTFSQDKNFSNSNTIWMYLQNDEPIEFCLDSRVGVSQCTTLAPQSNPTWVSVDLTELERESVSFLRLQSPKGGRIAVAGLSIGSRAESSEEANAGGCSIGGSSQGFGVWPLFLLAMGLRRRRRQG